MGKQESDFRGAEHRAPLDAWKIRFLSGNCL